MDIVRLFCLGNNDKKKICLCLEQTWVFPWIFTICGWFGPQMQYPWMLTGICVEVRALLYHEGDEMKAGDETVSKGWQNQRTESWNNTSETQYPIVSCKVRRMIPVGVPLPCQPFWPYFCIWLSKSPVIGLKNLGEWNSVWRSWNVLNKDEILERSSPSSCTLPLALVPVSTQLSLPLLPLYLSPAGCSSSMGSSCLRACGPPMQTQPSSLL